MLLGNEHDYYTYLYWYQNQTIKRNSQKDTSLWTLQIWNILNGSFHDACSGIEIESWTFE